MLLSTSFPTFPAMIVHGEKNCTHMVQSFPFLLSSLFLIPFPKVHVLMEIRAVMGMNRMPIKVFILEKGSDDERMKEKKKEKQLKCNSMICTVHTVKWEERRSKKERGGHFPTPSGNHCHCV